MDEVIVCKYKCCKKIFMACRKGAEDKEIKKEILNYAMAGNIVETISGEQFQKEAMGKCSCGKAAEVKP